MSDRFSYLPDSANCIYHRHLKLHTKDTALASMLLLNQHSESSQIGHLLYHPDQTCMLIPSSISRVCLFISFPSYFYCSISATHYILPDIWCTQSILSLPLAFVVSDFPKVNVNYHYVTLICKNVKVSTLTYGIEFKLTIQNASHPSRLISKVIYR